MKNKITVAVILVLSTLFFNAQAQMPEEIQWKHLIKTYTNDSAKMVLTLNGKNLQGKYKVPFDEGATPFTTLKTD